MARHPVVDNAAMSHRTPALRAWLATLDVADYLQEAGMHVELVRKLRGAIRV
jgi:hypothetical protein